MHLSFDSTALRKLRSLFTLLTLTLASPLHLFAQSPVGTLSAEELSAGQSQFEIHCARCHGMLGEGGEGPSLKRAQLTHAADDATLLTVIAGGIPSTGMPGIRLSAKDARSVAGYVRSLGALPAEPMPGDPVAGALVYRSTGNCASCHILHGDGVGLGPELSSVGLKRNAEYLRRAVTNPEVEQPRVVDRFRGTLNAFLTVRIVSEYGRYEGMRINEDEFTVQMRDLEGNIHSFEKAKLISYEKALGHSFMPGYSALLDEKQIVDVVSFLMSQRG